MRPFRSDTAVLFPDRNGEYFIEIPVDNERISVAKRLEQEAVQNATFKTFSVSFSLFYVFIARK